VFKFRIISFTALLGVLSFIFFNQTYGVTVFLALAALVAGLAIYELGSMLEKLDLPSFKLDAAFFGATFVWLFGNSFFWQYWLMAAIILLPIILGWGALLCSKEFAYTAKKLAVSAGLLLLTLPLILGLMLLGVASLNIFAYMVLVTKSGDTGAYCIGMLSNKITKGHNHPVAPHISPKKSIEGTVGGLVTAVGVSVLLGQCCGLFAVPLSWLLLAGILLFWGGFFGDLTESVLKRGCGIKDSGRILPGMGGVWDVLDSFIYNAPAFGLIFMILKLN